MRNITGLVLSYCLVLVGTAPLGAIAEAPTIDRARMAYSEGRFRDVARIGEALGTSQSLSLAAESLSIYAHYIAKDSEKGPLLMHAIEIAEAAVLIDADNADAHLQLARAIGRYAQTVSGISAAGRGYAEKVRQSTENALEIDPEMASAYISLGRWNAELVGALGPFMARFLYRAQAKHAINSFERALELSPDAKFVPLEYALGLLALDKVKNQQKVRNLLMLAIEMPVKDAYDRILHNQAVEHLKAFAVSDR